ncbi:hypothetical protein GCM10023142_35150 [Anaerocolumna aminovalerica]|uniref:Glycosyltransferase involved in cell wall bisynthesis n=1 Tax=Anaerocolumna aminovalerica TaxID=1527 RepID=A0A1I5EGQ5_9FIRM|nr:glycosyltransferase [Anaerocolumna aminovalerica]SFO10261.1 Glycosyltransferase involved in cell wall bisynthesis [Anaerocolumna aminovalerica]
MEKPSLLYVSPFWPKKSGISEYSEALISGLAVYFEITLVIDNYKIENNEVNKKYRVIQYNKEIKYDEYNYIIYNFGNNPEYHGYMYDMIQKYPGYVILHDYILYYLFVGYYANKNMLFQKIYEIEGCYGIQIVKNSLKNYDNNDLLRHKQIASLLPMNKEVIEKAKGVIVHSEYTNNIIKKNYSGINTLVIHLVKCETENFDDKLFLHNKLGIGKNEKIIGSVGFIAETKQNELACLAIKKYNDTHNEKIHYVMIGEGNYVDYLLDDYIHKTGFINNKDFFKAINSCSIILNLRYPYNGESSATLIQCMDIGIPCVVTNIGWFSEIPNNSVIKVPVKISIDELCDKLDEIIQSNLDVLVYNAKKYVKDFCIPEKVAKSIYDFLL